MLAYQEQTIVLLAPELARGCAARRTFQWIGPIEQGSPLTHLFVRATKTLDIIALQPPLCVLGMLMRAGARTSFFSISAVVLDCDGKLGCGWAFEEKC
jgi:hypothetical protein